MPAYGKQIYLVALLLKHIGMASSAKLCKTMLETYLLGRDFNDSVVLPGKPRVRAIEWMVIYTQADYSGPRLTWVTILAPDPLDLGAVSA